MTRLALEGALVALAGVVGFIAGMWHTSKVTAKLLQKLGIVDGATAA